MNNIKFLSKVEIINIPFYQGVIGTVLAHDNHHDNYVVELPKNLQVELPARNLKLKTRSKK